MFALFDTARYRRTESDHVKDQKAKGWFDQRNKCWDKTASSKKKKSGRSKKEDIGAHAKPSLNEELVLFKAIFKQITKHEVISAQANWFRSEERVHLRRLADLGILNHQPAVAAFVKTTRQEELEITKAILQQKMGHNSKSEQFIEDFFKDKQVGDDAAEGLSSKGPNKDQQAVKELTRYDGECDHAAVQHVSADHGIQGESEQSGKNSDDHADCIGRIS